jgi:hypothetical protein
MTIKWAVCYPLAPRTARRLFFAHWGQGGAILNPFLGPFQPSPDPQRHSLKNRLNWRLHLRIAAFKAKNHGWGPPKPFFRTKKLNANGLRAETALGF